MQNSVVKLPTSRTRAESDWSCSRRRFWQYEYNDLGLVPDSTGLELYVGTIIHDGLSAIAHQHGLEKKAVDIDNIARVSGVQIKEAMLAGDDSWKGQQHANEQATLVEALIRGYFRSVWPNLIAEYPIVLAFEEELLLKHDIDGKLKEDGNFYYKCIPDLVLSNGEAQRYVEFKSTSSKKEQWINSWSYAIQVHATAKTVEMATEVPTSTQVVGLYKGYENYGKLNTPLVYGYFKAGNPPFVKEEWSYEYKAGLKRTPVWEREGGVKRWIEEMPLPLLSEQFPLTGPIFTKDHLVEEYLAQRAVRESVISLSVNVLKGASPDQIRDIMHGTFPQKFSACNPGWGRECDFIRLCHGEQGVDPTKRGFSIKEER